MKKFEIMTKYLPLVTSDNFGEWIIDRANYGTTQHPKKLPFVNYSEMVRVFIKDVYTFEENNKDFMLTRYADILKENGIDQRTADKADISTKDGRVVMALIMTAVRAERFCEGVLLSLFQNGTITKWLKRLAEIDSQAV